MDGKVLTVEPYSYCEICLLTQETTLQSMYRVRDTLYNCFTLLND